MKAVIYFTEVPEKYLHKNMGHMIGEKLLATGLYKEYGLKLAFEPRAAGEHGKPFLTLQPKIHYNISHSGKYVMCICRRRSRHRCSGTQESQLRTNAHQNGPGRHGTRDS